MYADLGVFVADTPRPAYESSTHTSPLLGIHTQGKPNDDIYTHTTLFPPQWCHYVEVDISELMIDT